MERLPISIRLVHTDATLHKVISILSGYFGFGEKLSSDIVHELLNNGLIFREIKDTEVGDEIMTRNQFENNADPSLNVADEDRDFLGDRLYVPLPPLSDGHRYEISSLPSGASAVVIKKGDETVSPDSLTDRFARKSSDDKIVEEMHKHDRFGRRYAGGNENG